MMSRNTRITIAVPLLDGAAAGGRQAARPTTHVIGQVNEDAVCLTTSDAARMTRRR
jgi:hypothetical protein